MTLDPKKADEAVVNILADLALLTEKYKDSEEEDLASAAVLGGFGQATLGVVIEDSEEDEIKFIYELMGKILTGEYADRSQARILELRKSPAPS